MPPTEALAEPWRSFFDELDRLIAEPVDLHCFGGFVAIYHYGVARTTNDADFISLVPDAMRVGLAELGGVGSALHTKYKVYLDPVTIANPPDGYLDRLQPLFPGLWRHLNLYALEAHDLALAKLERGHGRDRDDVVRLARAGHLNPETLRARYYNELRPYLARESWHDQTLQMWIEACWPEESAGR